MFIRLKKIKGNDYAYLVENSYGKRGGKVRQRVKKYLGRVFRFSRDSSEFDVDSEYIDKNSAAQIVLDIVKFELLAHGFVEKRIRGGGIRYVRDSVFVDLVRRKIYGAKGNSVCLGLNEGILCDFMFRKLLRFDLDSSFEYDEGDVYSEEEVKERNAGMKLARMFVDCGLKVSPSVYLGVFSKVYK
jgi:hypothetical protein